MHAFTIDLEEWFCTHNFSKVLQFSDWPVMESRIQYQTDLLLEMLEKANVKGTFFILGWVAQRFPGVVRNIHSAGHEIGSHGFGHQPIWNHTPASFLKDLSRSTRCIEQITNEKPVAFRAPAFSLTADTAWATDQLAKAGYKIDSSVFPINVHPEYGMPDTPLSPYMIAPSLLEVPLSCVDIGKFKIPMSGGAYFRLLPYSIYKKLVKKLEQQGRTLNFYIHPWELDCNIPHIQGLSFQRRFRHYTSLSKVAAKLTKLLDDFEFGSLSAAFQINKNYPLAS